MMTNRDLSSAEVDLQEKWAKWNVKPKKPKPNAIHYASAFTILFAAYVAGVSHFPFMY
jgi:hypothetical protein